MNRHAFSLLFGARIHSAPVLLCLAVALSLPATVLAQSGPVPEKNLCIRNLRLIFDAIQHYRLAHRDLPDTLSDLHPAYLANPDSLYCPESKKRALTSITASGRREISDPKTSYFYEFNLAGLAVVPGRTNRDWKRAQMGLLGSVVPIVRCLLHERPLNLSFAGEVYESEKLEWEFKFTNVVTYASLDAEILLTPTNMLRVGQIAPRDPSATQAQLDLSDFFDASLGKPSPMQEPFRRLEGLPVGLKEFSGTLFDVRGVIQLFRPGLRTPASPKKVGPIPVNQTCRELHFLVGANLAGQTDPEVGRFDIRLADGKIQTLPVRIGTNLHARPPAGDLPMSSVVAWKGASPNPAVLFKVTWNNPKPAVEIRSIDCVGGTNTAAMFLLAISTSP